MKKRDSQDALEFHLEEEELTTTTTTTTNHGN